MTSSPIDLSILIVSWNVRDLLAACLDSIVAAPVIRHAPDGGESGDSGPRVEVLVVDSASSDGSAGLLRESYPWVRLFAEGENVGFVRGNNIALAAAQGRHLMLLNPDTVIHGDALGTLVSYLDAHPETGIVGPRVLNADGTTQSTRRRFPTRLTAFVESTWLQGWAPRRVLDEFYLTGQPDEGIFEVDWVQGCALVARRSVYAQIGGLDPRYIMFSEELDWCKRAKLAGWRVAYVGSAQITHYGGKSTEQVQARKHSHFQQSKLRYHHTYHGPAFALALRVFLLLSYSFQLVQEAIKALLGHRRAMRMERVRTYAQVIGALALNREPRGP